MWENKLLKIKLTTMPLFLNVYKKTYIAKFLKIEKLYINYAAQVLK